MNTPTLAERQTAETLPTQAPRTAQPPVWQNALTLIAPVLKEQKQALEALLLEIDNYERVPLLLPFDELEGVHFCRFLLLPGFTDESGKTHGDQLAYSSNYDGSLDDHLRDISKPSLLPVFYQVFSCCHGFSHSPDQEQAVRQFVLKNRKKVHTFYQGHRGMSVKKIRNDNLLYQQLQHYLDSMPTQGLSEADIKQRLDAVAKKSPNWQPTAPIKLKQLSIAATAGLYLGLPLLLLVGLTVAAGLRWNQLWLPLLLLWGAVLALLALAVVYLRYLEKRASVLPENYRNHQELEAHQRKILSLRQKEDKIIQNQLTHLVPLRKGWFRRTIQRMALWLLNLLAKHTFNQGRLGDISTIHFARWSMIDDGKRLLFFSNFDGSWENYLGDFVDRAAPGLTLAWSNTHEFPKTEFLVNQGATDEERFKNWARKNQVPTQVWYSAYKELTVKNIYRNHLVAIGIGRQMNTAETKKWLKLL